MKKITEKDIKVTYKYEKPKNKFEAKWDELRVNRAYDKIFERTKERILNSNDKKFDSLREWLKRTEFKTR